MRTWLTLLCLLAAVTAFAAEGVLQSTATMNNKIGSTFADTTGKDTLNMGSWPIAAFDRENHDHIGWLRFVAGGTTHPEVDTLRWWFNQDPFDERKQHAFYDVQGGLPNTPDWASATDIDYVLDANAMWVRLEHPDSLAVGSHIVTAREYDLYIEVSWSDTTTSDVVANRDSGYWECGIEWYYDDGEYEMAETIERLRGTIEDGNAALRDLVKNTKDLRLGP